MAYASKSLSENSITTPMEPSASYTNIGLSRWAMSHTRAEILDLSTCNSLKRPTPSG
jgi:hypothetical protein